MQTFSSLSSLFRGTPGEQQQQKPLANSSLRFQTESRKIAIQGDLVFLLSVLRGKHREMASTEKRAENRFNISWGWGEGVDAVGVEVRGLNLVVARRKDLVDVSDVLYRLRGQVQGRGKGGGVRAGGWGFVLLQNKLVREGLGYPEGGGHRRR